MKFTLSWLKTHLDTTHTAAELADKLTWLGLEVESLDNPAEKLKPFTIAYVESAEKHPNADRLKVCIVNTGTEKVQVVCGAPNAKAGMKGVFAPPGTHVPGTGIDLKISKIRDVESRGMLCSKRELQLSDEHDGIIELPADAPIGMAFADYAQLNDPVFEVKLTPNRPDGTGVRGIARDLAAANMGTLKPLKVEPVKGSFKSPIAVSLNFADADKKACPYFIGRYIRGVKNGPSPKWLQDYLIRIGLRPISALVDITNFFTFDAGRPLHVFDADKVKGNIHARLARQGEKLLALNGKEYALDESVTVIADDAGAEAIAGIIGGAASGCTENTVNVFLECAYFDPSRTTLSGRKLNILSDARYRFERGVDPAFMLDAAEMATRLILELCGGTASELVVAGAVPDWARSVTLPATRCKTLGGLDVPAAEQQKLLEAIGCKVEPVEQDPRLRGDDAKALRVTFPSWRPDMVGAADCVEEILRLKGYEAIQPVSLPRDAGLTRAALNPAQKRAAAARRTLAAHGLLEAVTWSFMPDELAKAFGGGDAALCLVNPISVELGAMRPSILPNLLQAARRNADRGFADAALFEVGPVYQVAGAASTRANGANGVVQYTTSAGVRAGLAAPRQWTAPARKPDLFDAKADALAVLEAAKAPTANLQATPDAPAWFHPGRSGVLRLGPTVLAHFGEVHPLILQKLDLAGPVAAFEVFLDNVPAPREAGPGKPLADLPDLQPVRRDYAFIVDVGVDAEKLLKAVKSADKALIVDAQIFDLYEGKGVPSGQKSLAVEVRFQPRDKTMTEAEIEALSGKIIAAAAKTGAVLRG